VPRDPLDLPDLIPDQPPNSGEAPGGVRTRVKVLTRGWFAALAVLVLGGIYLDGLCQPVTTRPISLDEPAGHARALVFCLGGEVLAASMLDGTIRRWWVDPRTGEAGSLGGPIPGFVAAFAPDGATLAVGDVSTVTLWDVASDQPQQTIRTEGGRTFALSFSRDGRLLAMAGEREVVVWNVAVGCNPVRKFPREGVLSLAFAPDCRSLATGNKEGSIRLWDLSTGQQRLELRAHGRPVTSLAFSDDGRRLASAEWDHAVKLWDVTGRELVTLRGHTASVQSVAFLPGSQTIATAAADGTVRLWNVGTGSEQAAREGLGVGAGVIAISPDGRTLATGGNEPTIWVWDVSAIPGEPTTKAVGRKRRQGGDGVTRVEKGSQRWRKVNVFGGVKGGPCDPPTS
jgi:sugar lactone lactonase YvrE